MSEEELLFTTMGEMFGSEGVWYSHWKSMDRLTTEQKAWVDNGIASAKEHAKQKTNLT